MILGQLRMGARQAKNAPLWPNHQHEHDFDIDVDADVGNLGDDGVDFDVGKDVDVEALIDWQADCSWRGVDVSLPCLGQALPSPR